MKSRESWLEKTNIKPQSLHNSENQYNRQILISSHWYIDILILVKIPKIKQISIYMKISNLLKFNFKKIEKIMPQNGLNV